MTSLLTSPTVSRTVSWRSSSPESVSFLLDLVRFTAAILVVAAHSGHPEFTTGFRDRQFLGDVAVPAFFVLSGFVIRLVTSRREQTLRDFLVDRASRIYSVALPAAILTLAVSFLCKQLSPAYYGEFFASFSTQPLTRIALNLSFLSQSWSHTTVFFVDSPFWSLSYECLYYLGYGLFFYLRGTSRIIALAVWAGVAGPQVLFLLPIWVLGCIVHELYNRPGSRAFAAAAAAIPLGLAIVYSPNPLLLLKLSPYRATMMALGTGIIVAGAMLLLLRCAKLIPLREDGQYVRWLRRLADGTFAIYLMHYPLMVLANTMSLFSPARPAISLLTLTGICILLVFVAGPLDQLKVSLRRWVRGLI